MKPPSIPQVSSAAATYKPSTLEKVERAITDNIKCDATGLAPAVASIYLSGFREAAISALNALRQVDDETVEAMADVVWRSFNDVTAYGSSMGTSVAEAVFTAGIDSILTEGGEG